jgi:hypothetical protein
MLQSVQMWQSCAGGRVISTGHSGVSRASSRLAKRQVAVTESALIMDTVRPVRRQYSDRPENHGRTRALSIPETS